MLACRIQANTSLTHSFLVCILIHTNVLVERDSRKLIKLLEQDGWVRVVVKGDHWQFKHPVKKGRVTVPHPQRDIKPGTVFAIYRQAGWR